MKKLLFFFAFLCCCHYLQASNYCDVGTSGGNTIKSDDFDNYYPGAISNQSYHWSTYSGYSANVVSYPNHSASRSLRMQYSYNHTEAVRYSLGYNSSGQYKLSFYAYIPSGKTGSYRINNPSDALSYLVRFNVNSSNYLINGTGFVQIDGEEKTEFEFPTDEWFQVVQVFNLDTDEVSLIINGHLVKVLAYDYGSSILKDVRFYTADNYSKFYIDDLCFGHFICYATTIYNPICANGYEFANSSAAQCYGITHYEQGTCNDDDNDYCCPADPYTQAWYLAMIEDLRNDCHNGYGPRVYCATYYGQNVISVVYDSYGSYDIDHPFGYVYDCEGNLLFHWIDGYVQQNLNNYNALHGEDLIWSCNDAQDCYQEYPNCNNFDYELLANNHLGLSSDLPVSVWMVDGEVVNTNGNDYFVYDCGDSEYVEVAIIYYSNGCIYKCYRTIQCNPYQEDPCCFNGIPEWLNTMINDSYIIGNSLIDFCTNPVSIFEPSVYCCYYNGQPVYRIELKNGNAYNGKVYSCSGTFLFSYSDYQNQYYYNQLHGCEKIWGCEDIEHPDCYEYAHDGENCEIIQYQWNGHHLQLEADYGNSEHIEIDHWEINGYNIPTDANSWTYTPPACGTYTICCYYWYNDCLLKCCREITCEYEYDDCCGNDPLSMAWLNDFIDNYGEDLCDVGCGLEIYCGTYYGQAIIEIQTPPYGSGCTDAMGQVYTCEGQYLFSWGGIAGLAGYNHISHRTLIWDCDELEDCDYLYEDFEDYNHGFITPQAPHWVTYQGGQQTDEDANVTTFGGDKVLKIYDDNPFGAGYDDVVCKWDNQSEGIYDISWKMYIPQGYSGYFNLQKYNHVYTSGGYVQVYFYTNGTARLKVGSSTYYNFTYNHNTWMDIKFRIDTDNNLLYFTPNGGNWKVGLNYGSYHLQLGGCNYYAYNYAKFYVDDIHITRYDCDNGYNLSAEEQTVLTDALRAEVALETADIEIKEVAGLDAIDSIEKPSTTEMTVSNYPNPFIHQTTIQFELPAASNVSIEVMDAGGQTVWEMNGDFDKGVNEIEFNNTANLPSGMYIYRITTETQSISKTMIKG